MNYKITGHFMPWEIDYCMLMYMQLKKSKYYLDPMDNISVRMVLNLSDYIIDWNKSQLPKEYFKHKFNSLAPLLKDYKFINHVQEGPELYGCLDAVRESVAPEVDFYINISSDIYFNEYLLYYLIESSKKINDKYFILTPQIPKMWDGTWDVITNEKYLTVPYNKWNEQDIFEIRNKERNSDNEVALTKINEFKFAGWFDLYNKAFYEELVPVRKDFRGYGPWDYYAMIVSQMGKNKGIDVNQWILKNQVAFEYSIGPLKDGGFAKYYKDLLVLKDIPNQRKQFEDKMGSYINDWINKTL